MKQYIILVAAVGLIISLNLVQSNYLNKNVDGIIQKIDNIDTKLNELNFESSYNLIIELEKFWKEKKMRI